MTDLRNGSRYYLGLDGGGTKTLVLLATERNGELVVLGEGQGGPSNPRAVGFEAAFQSISSALDRAFEAAQLPRLTADRMILCLAGTGRSEERLEIESWVVRSGIARHAEVISEAEAVLEATGASLEVAAVANGAPALGEQPTQSFSDASKRVNCEAEIALICGTGSMAWGRLSSDRDRIARSGGWGYLLGDEGSGFWIGRQLLQLACQTADRRANEIALLETILQRLGLDSPMQLVQWCYRDSSSRQRISELAPIAFEPTESQALKAIVATAADDLAAMIGSVASQLDTTNFRIAFAGSVVVKQSLLREQIILRLTELDLKPKTFCAVKQPVMGCIRRAIS